MDAHEREYAGAVNGMTQHTPPPSQEPAVGDTISGVAAGRRFTGQVEWIGDDGRIAVNIGGGWVYVSPADITH
jgi:hypothetical protein